MEESCSGPFELTDGLTTPVKIVSVHANYTEEARQARIQGMVVLRGVIDCEGQVTQISVVQGLSHGLTGAAIDAFAQWRFEPVLKDGEEVSVFYTITFNFKLN